MMQARAACAGCRNEDGQVSRAVRRTCVVHSLADLGASGYTEEDLEPGKRGGEYRRGLVRLG